jgi:hypothetical protein
MNRAQAIREWMATQDGPRTSRAMADAIGADPERAQWTVAVMLREGQMVRVRDTRPMLYVLGRAPLSKEETVRLAVEGRARRYAGFAVRRKAERLERQAKDAAERDVRRRAAEARRAEQRRLYEQRRTAKRKAERALAAPTKPVPLRVVKPAVPQVAKWERQTVEDFLASGGRIQRLDPGDCSQPLKRIGSGA